MSETQIKTRRRRRTIKKDETAKVKLSEKDKKHFDEDMQDADEETKTQWLKRRAAEDRALKENKKVAETWYSKVGSKLVRKQRNGAGSVLTSYLGNYKKHPEILTDEVKENLK